MIIVCFAIISSHLATDNYLGLQARGKGPLRLILGPWTHGDRILSYAGDVDFGADAMLDGSLAEDFVALRLRWFDYWLRGEENGVGDEAQVRDELARYREEIGIGHFVMRMQWYGLEQDLVLKSMERLGREVATMD